MILPKQYRRLLMIALLLLAALCALGFRLVELQVWRHGELLEEAEERTHVTFIRPPSRGDIRDCKENILAKSYPVETVCADPEFIGGHQQEVASALAPLLGMPVAELGGLLQPRTVKRPGGRVVPLRYQVLKHNVSEETWEQIRSALRRLGPGRNEKSLPWRERTAWRALREKSIFARGDQLRVYPNQNLAAHVLGYVRTREGETSGGALRETYGCDGIERVANSALSGMPGWRSTEIVLNREIVPLRQQDVQARAGLNVCLTLDAGIQNIVEEELARAVAAYRPLSASAIVVRPRTGEILALANWPTFDPAHPGQSPIDSLRDRAISDLAEPGSTFKIVVVSAALNEGIVALGDVFDCRTPFFYAGLQLHDHRHYQDLEVRQILSKSSNIGAAKIGLRVGAGTLYHYMKQYGFGTATGISLPGEVAGIVHPLERWTKASITRIPMGHEVAVTPLQMVMAMSAIANGGHLMRPMLIDHFEDNAGQVVFRFHPEEVRRVISEQTAQRMIEALEGVVSKEGTAPEARLEHYLVAGKTGTAQKLIDHVYSNDKYFSSFIGFLPAGHPELCISVVLDAPATREHVGGKTAAPVFREMAARSAKYLAVPADVIAKVETPWNRIPTGRASANGGGLAVSPKL